MNVVEKFLEKYNQCIVLLSGFEQLHLSEYAKQLAENLNFQLLKFDHPNYDSLNNEVNQKSKKGIVVYGLTFLKDNLKFKPLIHISLSGPKGLINDDEKFDIYNQNKINNFINKYENIKDLNYHDEIYERIFNVCIDVVMKRIYGDRYEEVQKEYIKLSEKEKYDTPKEDNTNKSTEDAKRSSEISVGGKRRKQKKVIGTRLLMKRITLG
jgi:hypothetical protein